MVSVVEMLHLQSLPVTETTILSPSILSLL